MDRALDELGATELSAHYDALLLGNLREDVYKFPLLRCFMLGKGLTHYYRPGTHWGLWPFVPGAPSRSNWLFERAVRLYRAGKKRDGVYGLGRVVHLLSEMAAPVHAQVVLHWRGDGFEMYIEHNARDLRRLPLPPIPEGAQRAGELVHRLAVDCQAFPCDRTNNLPGYLGLKLGLLRRHTLDEVKSQVHALVPLGTAYTVALYRLFLARTEVAQA